MKKLLLLLLLASCGVSHVNKYSNTRDSSAHDSTKINTHATLDSSKHNEHDSTEKVSTYIPVYFKGTALGIFYDSLNVIQARNHLPIYLPGETYTRFVHIHDASSTIVEKATTTLYIHINTTKVITKVITKIKNSDSSIVKNLGGHTFLYIAGIVILLLGALYIWLKSKVNITKLV